MLRRPLGKTGTTVSPQYVRQACDASLRRLGIDAIDADEIAALDALFDPSAVAGERYAAAGMTHLERA